MLGLLSEAFANCVDLVIDSGQCCLSTRLWLKAGSPSSVFSFTFPRVHTGHLVCSNNSLQVRKSIIAVYFLSTFLCLSDSLCVFQPSQCFSLNKPHQSTATTKASTVFRDGPHHALLHLRQPSAKAWRLENSDTIQPRKPVLWQMMEGVSFRPEILISRL